MRIAWLALIASLSSCRSEKKVARTSPTANLPLVEFVQVSRHDFKETREIQGKLQPIKTNTVIAQLATRVVQCSVRVGDRVKAGQIIARLDRKPTEQKVREARAQLTKAVRERDAAEQDSQRLSRDIEEARAELNSSETRLAEVKRDAGRAELALTQARAAAAQSKTPPAPTPDNSAKIPPLEADVARLEAALAMATESSKRRADERQVYEKRFAKSQELYTVGAISRNAFESDRKNVESAKQAEQSATTNVERAREELTATHAKLAKMRDTVRAEAASRVAKAADAQLIASGSKETQQARTRVDESARSLAKLANDIQRSHEHVEKAHKDLMQLEPRLAQARATFAKANEELANQSVLLGFCEVKASGNGVVSSIRGKGTAVKPGEVLCAIDDDSTLHFVADHLAADDTIPGHFTLKSSGASQAVEAIVQRDEKQNLVVSVANASYTLRPGAVSIEFVKEERKDRPTVPSSAIVRDGAKTYVFADAKETARSPGSVGTASGGKLVIARREVTVGACEGDWVEITMGVEGDEWVVARPGREWRERREIRVR